MRIDVTLQGFAVLFRFFTAWNQRLGEQDVGWNHGLSESKKLEVAWTKI